MKKRFIFPIIFILIILLSGFFFWGKKKERDVSIKTINLENNTSQIPIAPNPSGFPAEHPDSIPNMSQKEYHGDDLKLVKVLDRNDAYTRYSVIYKSEGLTVSGIMNIPEGPGPFPLLVLNHGYIEPRNYTNGQGLKREQDFFARHGYAVFHSDYRGYGMSDPDPDDDIRPRAGYVEDVIDAILAVKDSNLPELNTIDKEKIGMLGHSMGGGITENIMVIKPDIANAYALLAPINSDYKVNFKKWVMSEDQWSDTAKKFVSLYGTPEENTSLWDGLSAKNYLDKIDSPVILHQGMADDQVPVSWSHDFARLLQEKNKNITYFEYPGEGHIFSRAQDLVMKRTLEFFDDNLKK